MTEPTVATPDSAVAWHALSPADALERQAVKIEQGLTAAEADARRAQLRSEQASPTRAKEPRWQAFLRQYKDPMQIVLLAAGHPEPVHPGPGRRRASSSSA